MSLLNQLQRDSGRVASRSFSIEVKGSLRGDPDILENVDTYGPRTTVVPAIADRRNRLWREGYVAAPQAVPGQKRSKQTGEFSVTPSAPRDEGLDSPLLCQLMRRRAATAILRGRRV